MAYREGSNLNVLAIENLADNRGLGHNCPAFGVNSQPLDRQLASCAFQSTPTSFNRHKKCSRKPVKKFDFEAKF